MDDVPDLGIDVGPLLKRAFEEHDPSGMALESIPVDAFNRAVWRDVLRAPNPWGTRDPYGPADQPLHVTPEAAQFVAQSLRRAQRLSGSTHVSPLQVAIAAGESAGKGWLGGMVLGKTLGLLAGLGPEGQERLQQAGLWGGMLAGAVDAVFDR